MRVIHRKTETVSDFVGRLRETYVEVSEKTECWNWRGKIAKNGYGRIKSDNKDLLSHRFFYQALVGPIPDQYEIDHLCKNRCCVNPLHLEAVPSLVNWLRSDSVIRRKRDQVVCIKGHPLNGSNLYVDKRGHRGCKECNRRRSLEWFCRKRVTA